MRAQLSSLECKQMGFVSLASFIIMWGNREKDFLKGTWKPLQVLKLKTSHIKTHTIEGTQQRWAKAVVPKYGLFFLSYLGSHRVATLPWIRVDQTHRVRPEEGGRLSSVVWVLVPSAVTLNYISMTSLLFI